ncbi:MAG: HmuY family protein, partial [Solimonas sp.]
VYYDLANGTVVDLADTAAATSTAWQIAFRRFEIKLNGGTSGSGEVAGYMAKQLDGFYDADGNPVKAKFLAATPDNTLADLTANDYATPSSRAWVSDSQGSVLSPAYTGTYPGALSYGFYSYYPTASGALPAHRLEANTDEGALLRSGDGKSYARFHLSKIEYATPADATSAQTWTFEFNVQPAAE